MRSIRRILLTIFGVLFVAFGVGAFFGVPGGHDSAHHTAGHNLTHIFAGFGCIAVAWAGQSSARQRFCYALGAIYFLIGIFGVFSVKDTLRIVPGVLEFHLEDSWIQMATGFLFVGLGALRKKSSQKGRHVWAT